MYITIVHNNVVEDVEVFSHVDTLFRAGPESPTSLFCVTSEVADAVRLLAGVGLIGDAILYVKRDAFDVGIQGINSISLDDYLQRVKDITQKPTTVPDSIVGSDSSKAQVETSEDNEGEIDLWAD